MQKILYLALSVSPASVFTLLQPTSSLSFSHMHLLKRLPNKPCCFMPFSSEHDIFSMCYLSSKSLLREALLPHMSVPLSECLLCYCNYFIFQKVSSQRFFNLMLQVEVVPRDQWQEIIENPEIICTFSGVCAYFWKIL